MFVNQPFLNKNNANLLITNNLHITFNFHA